MFRISPEYTRSGESSVCVSIVPINGDLTRSLLHWKLGKDDVVSFNSGFLITSVYRGFSVSIKRLLTKEIA